MLCHRRRNLKKKAVRFRHVRSGDLDTSLKDVCDKRGIPCETVKLCHEQHRPYTM